MTQHFYALLVGINRYANPSANLRGCVNDMEAWQKYLEKRSQRLGIPLHLKTLANEQATRQAIISGFQNHLSRAKKDDLVLFFYAGHGSQEAANEIFWDDEPDHLNETLVCHDSRSDGGFDLADKELDHLIWQVAKNDPKITVILDCCHSGSGTREMEERRLDQRMDDRSLESYCFSSQSTERSVRFGSELLKGRHILLAACQDRETAKEISTPDGSRGVFSYSLLKVLEQADRELTYEELLTMVRHEIQGKIDGQVPQLETIPPEQGEDRQRSFLVQEMKSNQGVFTLACSEPDAWVVNGGHVQGWDADAVDSGIEFAVFPYTSTPEQMEKRTGQMATARVLEAKPTQSRVKITGQAPLNPDRLYKALITKAPVSLVDVFLSGDQKGISVLRQGLMRLEQAVMAGVQVREVQQKADAMVILNAQGVNEEGRGEYDVCRGPVLGEPMQVPMASFPYNHHLPPDLTRPLAAVAKWQKLRLLRNPELGVIPRDGVQLQLMQDSHQVFTGPEAVLAYQQEHGEWIPPRAKLMLSNRTRHRLYCAVLDLSSEFGIDPDLLEAGGIWLNPMQSVKVAEGSFSIPRILLNAGAQEYQTIFKLIASTQEFDARTWTQAHLSESPTRRFKKDVEVNQSDDWLTQELLVRSLAPQAVKAELERLAAELAAEDDDTLLCQLGQHWSDEVSAAVEAEQRSPAVTERPLPMRSPIIPDRGLTDWLERGQDIFAQLSPQAYEVLCSEIDPEQNALAQELSKLLERKTVSATQKAVSLLGPLLVSHLGLPQTLAFAAGTLLIRRVAQGTSNLVCENWKESLGEVVPVEESAAIA